jgi:D-alanyl-D-alanine carboxypeptidase
MIERLRRSILLTLLAASVAAPAGVATDAAQAAASRAKLQQQLNRIVARGVPGAVALVRDDRGTWRAARGFADRDQRVRMTLEHSFRIGSLTKSYVAAVVLQLAGEGRLTLDDTVERWLPGLVPNGQAITIRDLLQHTSGIFNFTDDPAMWDGYRADPLRTWAPLELLRLATARDPLFPPGEQWQYSNTNYIVLGLIVEAASGYTLETLIRERLFTPLGLTRTTFPSEPTLPAPHARAYLPPWSPLGNGRWSDSTAVSPSIAWAAGAVVSTADDVARFYRELLGGRLLPAPQLRAMRTLRFVNSNFQYGLGLEVVRFKYGCAKAWGHTGSIAGFQTAAFNSIRGRRQVVLLANTELNPRQFNAVNAFVTTAFCS